MQSSCIVRMNSMIDYIPDLEMGQIHQDVSVEIFIFSDNFDTYVMKKKKSFHDSKIECCFSQLVPVSISPLKLSFDLNPINIFISDINTWKWWGEAQRRNSLNLFLAFVEATSDKENILMISRLCLLQYDCFRVICKQSPQKKKNDEISLKSVLIHFYTRRWREWKRKLFFACSWYFCFVYELLYFASSTTLQFNDFRGCHCWVRQWESFDCFFPVWRVMNQPFFTAIYDEA